VNCHRPLVEDASTAAYKFWLDIRLHCLCRRDHDVRQDGRRFSMNQIQEIDGRLDLPADDTLCLPYQRRRCPAGLARASVKTSTNKTGLNPCAHKRDVLALFCCGEDWDHVEESGFGAISAEKETLKTTKAALHGVKL
jgi:hypothetical protein